MKKRNKEKRWWSLTQAIFFNLVIVFAVMEATLRFFPQIMPYSQVWNYKHHYAEIYQLIRSPEYLRELNPHVFLLGDSFTRGAEMPLGMEWASLVQNKFSERFLNLGTGGSSTVEQRLLLRHLTVSPPYLSLHPQLKIVLLGLYAGDIKQNTDDWKRYQTEGEGPFFKRIGETINDGRHVSLCKEPDWYTHYYCYYIKSYALATLTHLFMKTTHQADYLPEIKNLEDWHYLPEGKFYVSSIPDTSLFTSNEKYTSEYDNSLRITFNLIRGLHDFCLKQNLRLLVVYFPSQLEVYLEEFAQLNRQEVQHFSFGKKLQFPLHQVGIPFLDMTDKFRAVRTTEAPVFLKVDNHMIANGHRLSAQWISEFLKQYL